MYALMSIFLTAQTYIIALLFYFLFSQVLLNSALIYPSSFCPSPFIFNILRLPCLYVALTGALALGIASKTSPELWLALQSDAGSGRNLDKAGHL